MRGLFRLIAIEPKWVNFAFGAPAWEQLMGGDGVIFRFWLFTGGYKETSFTLGGAARAIAAVIEGNGR